MEVSVHQEPVGVTSATLVTERSPTQHPVVPAAQCATVLTWAPLPLQGTSIGAPLLVQSTSVGVPMLFQDTVLPSVTRAPIHMQGPTFTPVASEPVLIPGAAGAPASIQGMALPPMAVAPMLSQGMPVTGAYMDPPSWPMCMPSFLPQTQATPPTTLS